MFIDYNGFGITEDDNYRYAYMWISEESYYVVDNKVTQIDWSATIIGVSQNDDSILAKLADIYFKVQIDQESDMFNMCASASCTAYCAVWDSIAFTIMKYNGYTKEDLLLIHSGGKVGELLAEGK